MTTDTLLINEIFTSIDGEVNYFGQGHPTTFIRLSGCNLICSYCDTDHVSESKEMTIDKICNQIKTKKVTITGGEPLLQNLEPLLTRLKTNNHYITIETNGTIEIGFPRDPMIAYVIDFKLFNPSLFVLNNLELLDGHDYIKFPIANYEEFTQAVGFTRMIDYSYNIHIAFSPIYGKISPTDLFEWMIKAGLDYVTLNVQLHKLLNFK